MVAKVTTKMKQEFHDSATISRRFAWDYCAALDDPARLSVWTEEPLQRPLTVEEKNNRPKTLADQLLEQKMNAEEPWLIDIRGTITIPKTAAKQTARSTPDKRAPMTRPKTVQLGRIPLQKKAKSKKERRGRREKREEPQTKKRKRRRIEEE